jgi:hypothetical protein
MTLLGSVYLDLGITANISRLTSFASAKSIEDAREESMVDIQGRAVYLRCRLFAPKLETFAREFQVKNLVVSVD